MDELVAGSPGTATAQLDRSTDGLAHTATPPTQPSANPTSHAREQAGPVRRMLLAASAGGLVGALVASGPLVDAQGRVIGINTAIANPGTAQNVGFVIPISQAKPIIDRLRGSA